MVNSSRIVLSGGVFCQFPIKIHSFFFENVHEFKEVQFFLKMFINFENIHKFENLHEFKNYSQITEMFVNS